MGRSSRVGRRWRSAALGAAVLAATAVGVGVAGPSTAAAAAPAAPTVQVAGHVLVDQHRHAVRLLGVTGRAIAGWHVTAVRVPLNEDCWLGIDGVNPAYSGAAYQKAIENYVALLHRNGMAAILDLHWTDGADPTGGCPSATATCQKPMPDAAHTPAFWRSVASHFKNDRSTLFDLFNEPYPNTPIPDSAQAWTCWRDGGNACPGIHYRVAGMQSLVTAVRSTGAHNVVLVGGLSYSNDLSGWLRYAPHDPAHQLVASWHSYNFNACITASCWDSTLAPVAAKVPLIAGEIGENDCGHGYVDTLMAWLDAHKLSYLGWTWNTWDCSSGPALISSYDARDPLLPVINRRRRRGRTSTCPAWSAPCTATPDTSSPHSPTRARRWPWWRSATRSPTACSGRSGRSTGPTASTGRRSAHSCGPVSPGSGTPAGRAIGRSR